MLKKLFAIVLFLSAILMVLGNLELQSLSEFTNDPERNQQNIEEIEEEGIKLLNASISICQEIDKFGKQTNLKKQLLGWANTENQIIDTLNRILNFILFPVTLGLNLINLVFNCFSIVTGLNYRTNISTTSVFYTSDFTSGTSYGGGGGEFTGGR